MKFNNLANKTMLYFISCLFVIIHSFNKLYFMILGHQAGHRFHHIFRSEMYISLSLFLIMSPEIMTAFSMNMNKVDKLA